MSENAKTITVLITLIVTVVSMGVSVFNYFILNKLKPYDSRITVAEKAIAAVKEEHKILATKDQIELLSKMMGDKLENIDKKVDFLYQVYLK